MNALLRSIAPLFLVTGLRGPSRGLSAATATNSRAARDTNRLLVGEAINADVPAISQEAGETWLLLAPYGDTAYWHEETPGDWKQYTQVFEQPHAAKMVAAFNAVLGKRGTKFRGLPIYKGHPDADPKRWPDEARLGGVMAMDARADGLYVQAAWNDLGEANRAQGYLVYPSPAWLYNMRDAKRTGRIEPDELRSVGLTNSPRIADVDAWTNSDATHQPNADDTMIRKALLKILGLAEDATDDQIQTAVNSHFSGDVTAISLKATATNAETARDTAQTALNQTKEEKATLEGRVTAATTETTRFRTVATNALLDSAINANRLTAAERAGFEQQFATNFDAAVAALAAKTPALPGDRLNLQRTAVGDLTTNGGRRLAFNARVDAIMAERKISFNDACAAMRTDAEGKVIMEALDAADKLATKAA